MERGRPFKAGLDYFELECHMDEKVRLIQAEFGLKGFAVVVLLFKEIYGGQGYYLSWDEDRLLLFMSDNGVAGGDKNLIQQIVQSCIKRDIFSRKLFEEYHILTSSGIQRRYLRATVRRECVELKKEYLLLSDGINRNNVSIKSISVCRNSKNSCNNSQRREEKRKVEKSREYIGTKVPSAKPPAYAPGWSEEEKRVVEAYHRICVSYPKVRAMSDQRRKAVRARLRKYSEADLAEVFYKCEQSDFLKGANRRNWSADFDWMMNDTNIPKILEGKYDNRDGAANGGGQGATTGNAYVDAIQNRMDVVKGWMERRVADGPD